MIAGNGIAGQDSPAVGRVAGLRAIVQAVGASKFFRHVDAPDGVDLAVYLDGEPVAILPSLRGEQQSFVIPATLGDGEHRVDVYPVPSEQRGIPALRGAPYGRRALLAWPASTDADARAYLIYRGATSVGLGYGDPVAVVSGAVVHPVWSIAAGQGRVSVFGAWTGPEVNRQYNMQFNEGLFRHDVSGDWSDWEPIETGINILLDFGVYARFHSGADLYSSAIQFRVGPSVTWRSEETAEGLWYFGVKARDEAGNVGAMVGPFPMQIIHRPEPVANLRAAYDPAATEAVTLTWELPSPAPDAIEIYTNFSETFGVFTQDVIDVPWLELLGSAEQFSFTPGVNGLWRFQVRTRDAQGRRSDDARFVDVDTAGLKTGVSLNDPEQLKAVPAAGGTAAVSWRYRVQGGESLGAFRVYLNTDPEALSFVTPAATISVATLPLGPLPFFTWTSGVLAGTRWVTVRAVDEDGNETKNTDAVMVVPDAVAPTIPGDLEGAPG